jgi:tripartite-type tricarboxylate transporter receptor subunit TctC
MLSLTQAITRCGLALVILALALTAAQAQDFPTKPVRMIVGSPAGGSVDIEARIIGQKLGDVLGQQIVIENRPGASGTVGAESVAKAAPDGYTVFIYAGDFITVSSLMPHTTFEPDKELLPIAMVSDNPLVIVAGADASFSNVKEMIGAAKASPAGLTYATAGVASSNNVVGQWIAVEANIKLLHVPYRGGPEAALGAAAGDVDMAIISPASVYPALIDAGKVKVIALTGAVHPAYLPSSWPTLAENGLPIDATLFAGVFGPVGTPDSIVSRIDEAIDQALQDESVQRRMNQAGFNPVHVGPAAFAERILADKARYDRIIRAVGMQGDK